MEADERFEHWPTTPSERRGPLRDLRVLDFSQVLAGPLATMQLSDLGADVIKVEQPGTGDLTRHFGPPFTADGTATYFLAVNRDKRSLTLDLGDPRAARVARRLALACDVMVDNYLPGRLERFGLGTAELRAQHPGLITATVTGFGRDNEYADRPGFDFLAQAMGGIMAVTGQAGGPPTRVGVAIVDIASGLYLAQGILAALLERERSGRGRHVEIALLDTQVAMLVNLATAWLQAGVDPARFGNAHPSIAPYETLVTADGDLALAVGSDAQFRRLAAALGLGALADDARFATNPLRVRHRDELRSLLESRLGSASTQHWLAVLSEAGVPAAPVNTLPAVFADPVVSDRMVTTVGDIVQVLSPLRLDGVQPTVSQPPPSLGQHTDEILQALGLEQAEIAALHADGAV
jgi:crotonobetainyl-CoA:carnitine CoA-transferase CaiB-like acyl-CoA transferase